MVRRYIHGYIVACLLLALANVACRSGTSFRSPGDASSGHSQDQRKYSQGGIRVANRDVEFSGPSETFYGNLRPIKLSPFEKLIVSNLEKIGFRHHPNLSHMAREVAREAPNQFLLPAALVQGAMTWAGLTAPPPRMIIVEIPAFRGRCTGNGIPEECRRGMESMLAKAFNQRVQRQAHVGAAVIPLADGSTRLMTVISEPMVELQSFAKVLAPGTSQTLKGRLLGNRNQPRVEMVDLTGRWRTLPTSTGSEGSFSATISCPKTRGVQQVEVFAEGVYGPEVVANFPVYCGQKPPQSMVMTVEFVSGDIPMTEIEQRSFALINAERKRYGLAPLLWDDKAAEIARNHSIDMMENNFVGHRSPYTGTAGQRFATAGVKNAIVRENVASGYGPQGIHESLMNSPGHRVNILAPDVAYIGVGAVLGPATSTSADAPRAIYLTQNFFQKPGADIPKDPVGAIRRYIDTYRQQSKRSAITWDPGLMELAQGLAEGYARGQTNAAKKRFEAGLQKTGFRRSVHQRILAKSFQALKDIETWESPLKASVGIGLAQISKGDDRGALILVVVEGQK